MLRSKVVYSAIGLFLLLFLMGRPAPAQPTSELAQQNDGPMPLAELAAGKYGTGTRFSPDGKIFAIWDFIGARGFGGRGSQSNLRLWDVAADEESLSIQGSFGGFLFSPDSKNLISWNGSTVTITGVTKGEKLATLNDVSEYGIFFLKGGELLATLTAGESKQNILDLKWSGQLKFWETTTWKQVKTGVDNLGPFSNLCLTSDGTTLAAVVKEKTKNSKFPTRKLMILDVATGKQLPVPNVDELLVDRVFGFTSDDQALVVLSLQNKPFLWNPTKKKLQPLPEYLPLDLPSLLPAMFPNYRRPRKTVRLVNDKWVVWDVATQKKINELENSTGLPTNLSPVVWITTRWRFLTGSQFPVN